MLTSIPLFFAHIMSSMMCQPDSTLGRRLTLVLCFCLHAFTHAFGVLLVPLYLLIRDDLGLNSVNRVTLVVAIYGLVYCLGSYGAGVLADRFNRVWLLGIGLIGNAAAFAAMGLTHSYGALLALGVVAGLFGTLYHPAANALIPAHYPRNPGMAIGWIGAGSGLGFFLGPQIAGWRAQSGGWTLGTLANWQRPCVELGLIGIAFGIAFLLLAREARARVARRGASAGDGNGNGAGAQQAVLPAQLSEEAILLEYEPKDRHVPMGPSLRWKVLGLAAVLDWRDFGGNAVLTLVSIYLQKAGGMDVQRTGFILGAMVLLGVVANPLGVMLTGGRRRLPGLALIVVTAGLIVATTPLWPMAWTLPVLCAFQTLQSGSFSVSDAANLERIPPEVRGRFVGLFMTLVGVIASVGPWLAGYWTDWMGDAAREQRAYLLPFGIVGVTIALSALSVLLIHRLGPVSLPAAEPAGAQV